jgi:intracellular sulfur oxidation DsrE/DsrF family protein
MTQHRIDRRHFVGSIALAGAALATGGASVAEATELRVPTGAPDEWDHAWLKQLNTKHRAFFDTRSYSSEIFGYPARYRAAMIDGYGAKAGDIRIIVGLHGAAWPVGIDDTRWASLGIGDFTGIADQAGTKATRNPMRTAAAGSNANTLESAQQQGVIVLLCNNTLRRMARDLATRRNSTADAVYAELRSGVLPGVIVVPAMIAAVGLAQERGASYLANG